MFLIVIRVDRRHKEEKVKTASSTLIFLDRYQIPSSVFSLNATEGHISRKYQCYFVCYRNVVYLIELMENYCIYPNNKQIH